MKILEVTLDKKLTIKDHISGQLKKVYAKSAALILIRRFLPTEVMMSLLTSLFCRTYNISVPSDWVGAKCKQVVSRTLIFKF